MSASSKKKLRNELNAAKMTERQLQEQKEAKKLKLMTIGFTAVLALILVVAVTFASVQFVRNSGIREKNTAAVTIGDTQLSNAQLNYFYVDAVYEFANTYGAYASMFGLDLTKPLDKQVLNEETGLTWADDFATSAISTAQSTYALCAEAEANGFTLTEDQLASIETNMSEITYSALMNGFSDAEKFVKAYYGPGATMESFREYIEMTTLANAYYNHYAETLTYDEAALRAGEEGKEQEFNYYSYHSYYLNASKFLEGGVTDENGTVTYTDEERAAALAKAEEAAKLLTAENITSVEELDNAIAALPVNAESETPVKSTACVDYAYGSLTSVLKDWVIDPARIAGEVTYLENVSTTTAEDGSEVKTVNGYYVVFFLGSNDNSYPLANVRHILITPEGGTINSTTGATEYTDEAKAAAKLKAEELLKQWQDGKATEESFSLLASEHTTDPGSKENGGLYEDVVPGQMVEAFNDWCFAEGRKAGDTGIVETPYGFHIMFYSGDSTTTYRDILIENALRSADVESWYTALVEACTTEELNTKYLSRSLVLAAN